MIKHVSRHYTNCARHRDESAPVCTCGVDAEHVAREALERLREHGPIPGAPDPILERLDAMLAVLQTMQGEVKCWTGLLAALNWQLNGIPADGPPVVPADDPNVTDPRR